MKEKITIFILAIFFSLNMAAQSGWSLKDFPSDELKGIKGYTAYTYSDEKGSSLVMWDNSNNQFRITCDNGIFDYDVDHFVRVIIGFYDVNNNLTAKKEISFFVPAGKSGQATYTGKRVTMMMKKLLLLGKGYVRIIAPLYGKDDYELDVPSMPK